MKRIRPKRGRIRLDAESYKKLCLEVLHRDGWTCQNCAGREGLQVHHKQFRSHSGNDSEVNLITLCAACHSSVHS